MREEFSRRLEEHRRIARREDENLQGISSLALRNIVNIELENLSREAGTSVEAQRAIQIIQQNKQEIILKLHEDLGRIDCETKREINNVRSDIIDPSEAKQTRVQILDR